MMAVADIHPGHTEDDEAVLRALGLTRPRALPAAEGTISKEALDLLARLRAIVPRRPLFGSSAYRTAEAQAHAVRRHLGITSAQIPTEALEALPFLTVTYREGFPTSGMATRIKEGWIIVIRADEPQVRQRFSLAHELKHLLDDPYMGANDGPLADGLYPATRTATAHERTERICDAFAAALLMPRTHIQRDWLSGRTDIADLARRYGVSRAAMDIRLRQLRFIQDTPRCAPPGKEQR